MYGVSVLSIPCAGVGIDITAVDSSPIGITLSGLLHRRLWPVPSSRAATRCLQESLVHVEAFVGRDVLRAGYLNECRLGIACLLARLSLALRWLGVENLLVLLVFRISQRRMHVWSNGCLPVISQDALGVGEPALDVVVKGVVLVPGAKSGKVGITVDLLGAH